MPRRKRASNLLRRRVILSTVCKPALQAVRVLVCASLLALPPLLLVAVPLSDQKATSAFVDEKTVEFTPETSYLGRKLRVGNVLLGQLLPGSKPSDSRLNLYVVMPGDEYHPAPGAAGFNLVLNDLPRKEGAIDWDVYWALVLDPQAQTNLTSERALILAAQGSFTPDASTTFEDLPAAQSLREHLHVNSFADLDRYRRPDGNLPRVVIVPAGFAVRAAAVDPSNLPPCGTDDGRPSRTVSKLSRHCAPTPAKPDHTGENSGSTAAAPADSK
jgi:hypothetical protein